MITIGLVGGVASGKSAVACDFQKLGACVLDGDRIGHEVLGFPDVRDALVAKWGDQILASDGKLDRSAIAQRVFTGNEANSNLDFLESITHPQIHHLLNERVSKMEELDRFPICVIDAAVMLKAGWDSLCDHIVFVDAPNDLRKKRALMRGMSTDQFEARETQQTSVNEKKQRANFVIDNSGPPQNTFTQVEALMQLLVGSYKEV